MTPGSDSKNEHQITTIFFDVGGILLDDFVDSKAADLARKYGREPAEFLQLRKKLRPLADMGKTSDREFWRSLLKESGLVAEEADFEIDAYMHLLEAGMDLAARLKRKGYRLAILSNDSKEMFSRKRELFGFDALFQDIIVSNEHGCIKPHPEIYKIALRRMNVKPRQAVFIDDRSENLINAKKLGMYTVLYQNAGQVEGELIKLGIKLPPGITG